MHGCRSITLTAALLLLGTALATAQTPPATTSPLAFDVVSVKEVTDQTPSFFGVMPQPDGVNANASVKQLAAEAFGMRPEFVACKLPLCEKPLYAIRGKIAAADRAHFDKLSGEDKLHLLQSVLADRFGLQSHVETRPTNVYDLVIAKGGSKLKPPPTDPASDKSGARGANGELYIFPTRLRGFAIGLGEFTDLLSQFVGNNIGRPVLNKTGLTGTYDIDLQWTDPVRTGSGSPTGAAPADADTNNPGIFAALPEQLGLELKAAREPAAILVIDRVHAPTPD